jgi:hypothetical protein
VKNQEEIFKQVARSGFPFQLKVEDEVRSTFDKHRWSVESREHPWGHPELVSSGFIDIVLKHEQYSTCRLVMECKRIKADDARQLRWIFLLPDSETRHTELATCLEVVGQTNCKTDPPTWNDVRLWDHVLSKPKSLQSEFCVLTNDEQRRQPILESLAAEVLESIEGLAQEEINIKKSQNPSSSVRLFIFPVIVTNADLVVCRFNSNLVNIHDGTLDSDKAETSSVPFIRFRKSLGTSFPPGSFNNLKSANQARERTVFVVNAASITEFLTGWEINPWDRARGYAVEPVTW